MMEKNIIFILTEGDHDAAFIYRILKANGMHTSSLLISEYPYPLNKLFQTSVASISVDGMNVASVRSSIFLPSRVMGMNDNLLLIYQVGGDSKEKQRVDLINKVNDFNVPDPSAFQVSKDNISFLFFFDADQKGIQNRLEQIKNELKKVFAEKIENIANKEVVSITKFINVGCFIFTQLGKDCGLLEDVLIPLMQQGNDDIFDSAKEFLSIHEKTSLFKDKIQYEDEIIKKVNGQKYAQKKIISGNCWAAAKIWQV